ncbi:hypothetical protein [Rhodococcus opacus]|uniref:hypothetical protein n=1 Tax=Rhodococcus opacus TaxID=37919 RepID=UPI0022362D36|nr:hypothetical protein [Rhodococcus opacus]UZG57433.1 hypothetical protein ONE62_09110 [Rhodococcus opacus]
MATKAGFTIERQTLVGFPLITMVWRYWTAPYNSRFWTTLDRAVCAALQWNLRYHSTSKWRKLRPTSAAMVPRRAG